MKNTRRIAQVIAGLLALMMIVGVILLALPSTYAAGQAKNLVGMTPVEACTRFL